MLTQHIVAEAAQAAGIDAPARYVAVTGSTNADLAAAAEEGAPAWTVLVAGHQEGGRGRLGRTWESKPGMSLLVSILLRPSLAPDDAPLLSLAAAVAVTEACMNAAAPMARCKWPNDVVVGGRKLGGILVEASVTGGRIDHVVIGIGINVSQAEDDFSPDLRATATSLAIEGGADHAGVLRHVLAGLRRMIEPQEGLRDRVPPRYRELCATLGRRVRASLGGDEVIEGVAVDIGPRGELLVNSGDQGRFVSFGEVVHLD